MRKTIQEELKNWSPERLEHWLLILLSLFMFAISVYIFLEFQNVSKDYSSYHLRDEFVIVYDYTPSDVIIDAGENIQVSYLYRKAAHCVGSVTYSVLSDDQTTMATFGPYVSGWPVSTRRTWITQQFPEGIMSLSPGSYDVSWQVIGVCGGRQVYTQSPTTHLLVR